jgi:two-component system, LytTR family, response regulator
MSDPVRSTSRKSTVQARKLRTIVVDDEPLARSNVMALLRRDPDVDIVGECGSGAEAISAIDRTQPDLVFLDIQMPECTGFDVLEQLGSRLTCEIVFVTAHDIYALQAFEAGALDYLLKPFADERFEVTLRRIKSRMVLRDLPTPDRRLFIRSVGRISIVHIDDIDWIEAADYYACLHVGAATHLIRKTINELEHELDSSTFCRIHRSSIVNVRRIETLALNEGGEYDVVLQDGHKLRLSRGYRQRLQARLKA